MSNEPMEVAQVYLGNLSEDKTLAQKVEAAQANHQYLEVFLAQTDPGKGRIQARSTTGITVGIIKDRSWSLRADDLLITESGKLLRIQLKTQKVMVLTFAEPVANHATDLVHLGHVLGNHHWPIEIHDQAIYLQAIVDKEFVEKTIQSLRIPGLKIDYEWRSPQQPLSFDHHHHH